MIRVLLFVVIIGALALQYRRLKANAGNERAAVFDRLEHESDSQIDRILLAAARPLTSMPAVQDLSSNPSLAWLERRLLAAGGAFGASLDVFLAVQAFAAALGISTLLFALLVADDTLLMVSFALGGVAITAYPYQLVDKKAKSREATISEELPQFADLLQMPLTTGMTVMQALDFTARKSKGLVADEVENLLTVIRSKSMTEAEAFTLASERLATPEARQFFMSLLGAHLDGTKVAETLRGQAEALRRTRYQRMRSQNKKLPTKLTLIMFVHLLPAMFIIALTPAVLGMLQGF